MKERSTVGRRGDVHQMIGFSQGEDRKYGVGSKRCIEPFFPLHMPAGFPKKLYHDITGLRRRADAAEGCGAVVGIWDEWYEG